MDNNCNVSKDRYYDNMLAAIDSMLYAMPDSKTDSIGESRPPRLHYPCDFPACHDKKFLDFFTSRFNSLVSKDYCSSSIGAIFSNKSKYEFLRTLEIFTEDFRMHKSYFDKDSDPNYYDIIPNVLAERYPQMASIIKSRIDSRDHGIYSNPLLGAAYSSRVADNLIASREKFFSELELRLKKIDCVYLHNIDMTDISYLSYAGSHGMLSYAHSINSKSYEMNYLADDLFKAMLSEGVYDAGRSEISILFSGLSMMEINAWSNLINERNHHQNVSYDMSDIDGRARFKGVKNRLNDNVALYDSSITATHMHMMFSGADSPSFNYSLSPDKLGKVLQDSIKGSPGCKQIIIRHNGLNADSMHNNYSELSALKVLKGTDSSLFYTIPTVNMESVGSYSGDDITFPDSTLTELLLVPECDLPKFGRYEIREKIGLDSYRILSGFKMLDDVVINDQWFSKNLTLKKSHVLLTHSSNRYGPNDLLMYSVASDRAIFGDIRNDQMVALR